MSFLPRQILYYVFTLGIIISSGCTNFSAAPNATSSTHNELTQYLNTNSSSERLLTSSPWGSNVQVIADAPYFAASGHTCRQLQVSQANGNTQQHIACKLKNGNWTISRDIKQQ